MKHLEHRAWFVLLSLALSAALTYGLWFAAGLPLALSAGVVFTFATLGVLRAVSPLLALALIKLRPELGRVDWAASREDPARPLP